MGINVLNFHFSFSLLCVYSMTGLGCLQLPSSLVKSQIKEMGIIKGHERKTAKIQPNKQHIGGVWTGEN
jgi:hypothetical protein